MTIITSIVNSKGGVGKSSIAIHLAEYLAKSGFKTLLFDFDPNGSITNFYNSSTKNTKDISSIFTNDPLPVKKIINQINHKLFFVNASFDSFRITNYLDTRPFFRECVFSDYLDKESKVYDYIIIDTAGRNDTLVNNAYFASNNIIVPTIPDMVSMEQTQYTIQGINLINEQLSRFDKLGIQNIFVLFNRVVKTNEHRSFIETGKKDFIKLSPLVKILGIMSNTIKMAESLSCQVPMYILEKNHKVTNEMNNIFKQFVEKL